MTTTINSNSITTDSTPPHLAIKQHETQYHLTTNTNNPKRSNMRVLLLGATGNLGLRLIPALLTHSHTVIAYVRSASKLQSSLPVTVHESITVVQGDATSSHAIKTAILENKCDAVINTAGVAALAPWASSDLPEIFRAVVEAVREAGDENGSPRRLRVWMMGGQGVLFYPGTRSMLSK